MKLKSDMNYFQALRNGFERFSPLSDDAWLLIQPYLTPRNFKKGDVILQMGEVAKSIYFLCQGVLRAYCLDQSGNTYNKNIFLENDFSGSTVSLILQKPSTFTIEALEDGVMVKVDYQAYKTLVLRHHEWTEVYINYLEKNWVIDKEKHEVSLVMEQGKDRYTQFLIEHPGIEKRIAQHHIAAHLGITPTQLSRIKKEIAEKK